MENLRVSVIIPAYNEQATILSLLTEVRAQKVGGVSFQVIVVNDGSRDQTLALLRANPHLYDTLIDQSRNQGKGAAVLAGLKVATGDYILFQDADLEYSPSHYSDLIYPVQKFDADIVMGSRFMARRYTRVQFFWHKVGNELVTLVFNMLFNTTFTDIYTCYLLYRRDLIRPEELISRGWEQHAEILCRATRRAKVLYEVPINYQGRSYEDGKKIRVYDAFGVLSMIFRRRFFSRARNIKT